MLDHKQSYLDNFSQDFFSLKTAVDCSPLTMALREEKFFTALQLWAMSIHWPMMKARASGATPPRTVAMTTRETLLKCSMQARTVGAFSVSLGRRMYVRHWGADTLRKRR